MPKQRRVVVYVRLSVAQDASVSIDRQVEEATAYAERKGWHVVGVFKDDGVSASKNKPESRPGWRNLMAFAEPWDAVIVWKLDRLVRRIVHFWDTYKWLDERGKSLVSVEDNLDMTTTIGRMLASLLAGFAEMEAEAISTRVAGARKHLLGVGRVPGGRLPYGYKSVPNPNGPGFIVAQDPERIEYVREAVQRTIAGRTLYSTMKWLDEAGAIAPGWRGVPWEVKPWSYSTLERLLRNPILAGMVAHNPGNTTKIRGDKVLLGADGLPVVYEGLAVLSVGQWRAMVRSLDDRNTAQSRPVALRATTSGMLSGLVFCGQTEIVKKDKETKEVTSRRPHPEDVRMWRGTIQGRPGYYCPECHHAISNFEDVVVAEFLRQKGERVRWTVVTDVRDGGEALAAEITVRIKELRDQQDVLEEDDDEYDRLEKQIRGLRDRRRQARSEPSVVTHVAAPANFFQDDWAAAETDEERRDILGDALHRVTVRRGRPGRRTDAQVLARLTFHWKQPDDLGPIEVPADERLAEWAEDA